VAFQEAASAAAGSQAAAVVEAGNKDAGSLVFLHEKETIMKRLLFSVLLPFVLFGVQYPEPPGKNQYIVDDAQIISASYKQQITDICKELETSKGIKMQVLTTPSMDGEEIGSFAENVRLSWVDDTLKDNSLLIVVSKDDHEVTTSLGESLKAYIPQSTVDRVRRDVFISNFKEGNYGRGIFWAVRIYERDIQGTEDAVLDYDEDTEIKEGESYSVDQDAIDCCVKAACLFSWWMWWQDLWDHDHHHHSHRHGWSYD
jgi:uncharacterized membrane protein YgcG